MPAFRSTLYNAILRIALIASSFSLGGCHFFRAPYSPLPAFSPQPDQLGTILPELQKRWGEVSTYRAGGELAISGEGVLGTIAFSSNAVYGAPDRFRLGFDRGPRTWLEVLQLGTRIGVMRPDLGIIFVGNVEELKQHPGVMGGVEPLEIARALLVGETFMDAIRTAEAAGKNPGNFTFQEDKLLFAQDLATPEGGFRREEFTVRQRDGLIENARLVTQAPGQRTRNVEIEYKQWGVIDGRPYPTRLVIRSSEPETRLAVKLDPEQVAANPSNPPVLPQAFGVDSRRYPTTRPLQEFLQQTEGN